MDRFLQPVLFSEPPLDPQEHIDPELWKQYVSKARRKQQMDHENSEYEQYLYEKNMEEEELINNWRMEEDR